MRFVVYGMGAIGGVVAAQLHSAGNDVVGIARGAQFDAVRRQGLRLSTPAGSLTADIAVVDHPERIAITSDDVVLMAVKSQDTAAALSALAGAAPAAIPVACLQNGVANEPAALRRFARVYGVLVNCPATYLEPGVVLAHSAPVTGLLDVGVYPGGTDPISDLLAEAFAGATFDARSVPDIMRWKHTKLLSNLGNAVQALCGADDEVGSIVQLARDEGRACLDAAGIAYATPQEDRKRRSDLLQLGEAAGHARPGGSTWQSLARGTGTIETDYLSGEIVLLGRLHGVATPVNALLQQLARDAARSRSAPGALSAEQFMQLLERRAEAR